MASVKETEKALGEASKNVTAVIKTITDADSFMETDKFIRSDTFLGGAPGEGVVTGFASIEGINTAVFAVNPDVLKGGIGKLNAAKIAKCVRGAIKTYSPVIGIIDSFGARFAEGIEALEGYGDILAAFSEAYGSVPVITVVKGNNLGMLSYLTAVSDAVVCYENSIMATASPLVLAAGTSLDVSSVGTASNNYAQGAASVIVKSDAELKEFVKKFIPLITVKQTEADDITRQKSSLKKSSSLKEIIDEAFDAGSFLELGGGYGKPVTAGLARLGGFTVGIIATDGADNCGRLTADAADKANDIADMCDTFGIPLISISDSMGAEATLRQGRLMKSVGNMINTLNYSSAAKIALITGKAVGIAYTALASKAVFDYTVAWESAEISSLGGENEARLIYASQLAAAKDKEAAEKLIENYKSENTLALAVSAKGFLDSVIVPSETRLYLLGALRAYINKE